MPTSVKRIAGQSFKFGWTHTNSAGHNTFIRTDSIKSWIFHPFFGSFGWSLLLIYLEKAGLSRQNTDNWHVWYISNLSYNAKPSAA